MISLRDLVREQRLTGKNDIQVIKAFFDLNDMEEEAVELITELSKIKIDKLKNKQRMVKEWASYLPSKYLYENYDLDTADKLHTLELDYLSNGGKLSKRRLEWAKENLHNIKMPEVYFVPLVEWLEKQGIKFMDQT